MCLGARQPVSWFCLDSCLAGIFLASHLIVCQRMVMYKMPIKIGTTCFGCCEDWVHRYLGLKTWACNRPVGFAPAFHLFLPTCFSTLSPPHPHFSVASSHSITKAVLESMDLRKPGIIHPRTIYSFFKRKLRAICHHEERGSVCAHSACSFLLFNLPTRNQL